MLGFLSVPTGVAYLIVTALAHLLTPLGAGVATAAAIVFLTAAVRLLLFPLSYHAFRGQARLTALQPKIADLRTRWARQPDRLQAELTALYRAEGGGLLAGCLPMLVQLPFFSVLYHLVESRVIEGRPNGLLTSNLLTTSLGSHWLTGAGPLSSQGLIFAVLFALLAGAAYLSVRVTGAAAVTSGPAASPPLLTRVLPYGTVVVAAVMPLAAGLYLLTTTAWTAAERAVLSRRLAARSDRITPQATP